MNYCLEIQVTLTDELGDTPPPSHAWTAPVVEDMLREVRAGLTEAVVIGPGRAILFYGSRSMGEGLKADGLGMPHSSSQVQGHGWGSQPTSPLTP